MTERAAARLLQLLQKVRRLEVLGHGIVHARDDLVDRLLPRLLGVLAALDGAEELAKRLLHDEAEVWRHLKREEAVSKAAQASRANGDNCFCQGATDTVKRTDKKLI